MHGLLAILDTADICGLDNSIALVSLVLGLCHRSTVLSQDVLLDDFSIRDPSILLLNMCLVVLSVAIPFGALLETNLIYKDYVVRVGNAKPCTDLFLLKISDLT